MKIAVLCLGVITLLFSCNSKNPTNLAQGSPVIMNPEYATGFGISDYGNYKKVTVFTPFQEAENEINYYLIPVGSDLGDEFIGEKVIEVPVKTIVCTSTTHIPLLDYLDEEDALVGFPSLDYISTPSVRKLIDSGKIAELGSQISMNNEILLSLHPDMVMSYTLNGDVSQLEKIEQSGIPVILNSEYLESHPLGRAEWIKFLAVFFDKLPRADSVFNAIKSEYNRVADLAEDSSDNPDVLSGVVYGDTWFMPGGNNYASKLIMDAGGNYLWGDNPSSGFLELGFESVYEKAVNADFWIGVASYNSLQQLADGDSRYTKFRPFIEKKVYSYGKRVGATGGNEYLELGYLRPDIILKDLVSILHPGLLKDHEMYFYMQLK